jgi:DNA-binding transcriptional LysR family regulator
MVDAVRSMLRNDPLLRIQISEAEPPGNIDLLRTSQCDVLVSFKHGDEALPRGYRSIPVLTESYVLLLPTDHPLAGNDVVSLADCMHEQWIGGCPRCSKELVETCLEHGFDPEIVCSTDDLEATSYFTAAGVGIALRPALNMLARSLDGIAAVRVDDAITRHVAVLARTSDTSSYPEILADLLRGAARRLVMGLPEHHRRLFTIATDEAAA